MEQLRLETAGSCREREQLLFPSFGGDIPHPQHGKLYFAHIPVWSSQVWGAEGSRGVVSDQNSKEREFPENSQLAAADVAGLGGTEYGNFSAVLSPGKKLLG